MATGAVNPEQPTHDPGHPTEVVCHECGLAHHRRVLAVGEVARCSRCGYTLYRHRPPTVDRALALTLAGVFLFIVANIYPFLGFEMGSNSLETTLITGALKLFNEGQWILAGVVAGTSVVAPALQLAGLLYVLVPARFGRAPRDLARVLRVLFNLVPWSMMDVFLLGIFVSVVKLGAMATIVPGPALLAFVVLIFVVAAAQSAVDVDRLWTLIPVTRRRLGPGSQARVTDCHTCHLSVRLPASHELTARCPRCETPLHRRKPESLQRTWALLIAAIVCYIPANMLPIMRTTSLGNTQADTILSGVMYLLHHGDWPLALVVFVASVLVPFMKMLIIVGLLISVHRRVSGQPAERTRLYRITEAVGRWSMLDIYVVTILVAMVQLGDLATIEAGWGALFFAAVVVMTMLAAMSFDPRLIWDTLENKQREHAVTRSA